MTVSGVSTTDSVYSSDMQNAFKQRMNDFKQLGSSLQSGDLAGAQKAFSALQQDVQASGQQSGTNTQTDAAMQKLQDSLKSGDLAGAQQAFAALKQGHGHHRHRTSDSTQSSPTTTASTGNTSTGSSGSIVDVTV